MDAIILSSDFFLRNKGVVNYNFICSFLIDSQKSPKATEASLIGLFAQKLQVFLHPQQKE